MRLDKKQVEITDVKNTHFFHFSYQGFTLLEVMVALAIFAIGILGVATIHISSISGNDFAMEHSESLSLAKSRIDRLMTLPYASVVTASEVINGYTVAWTVNTIADLDGDGTGDMKQIGVTVQKANGAAMVTLNFSKPNL